jgi:hypothetical protein
MGDGTHKGRILPAVSPEFLEFALQAFAKEERSR